MGVETFLFEPRAWPFVKTVRAVSLAGLLEDIDLAIVAARGVPLIGIEDITIILLGWPIFERLVGKFLALLSVTARYEGSRARNTFPPVSCA